jgi:uncharacterized protein YecE (DUF72 family)
MARFFAGTSGFSYPSWKPDFYPKEVSSKKFLEHYARRLNSVEINYTFRALASAATLNGWVAQVPENFAFSCKAHQKLTHILRMKDTHTFIDVFLKSLEPLRAARRLGPVLFQLPPNFKLDIPRLEAFLPLLPTDIRYTFEFRNESWLDDTVFTRLADRNIALCLAESERLEIPKIFTADFTYFRLRKAEYDQAARDAILRQVEDLRSTGRDVYLYFKHEDDPQGAIWAEDLVLRAQ